MGQTRMPNAIQSQYDYQPAVEFSYKYQQLSYFIVSLTGIYYILAQNESLLFIILFACL